MYKQCNVNPMLKQVGDCTVRALSVALDQDWHTTYIDIAIEGYIQCDMPSANRVWGNYLKCKGYRRKALPETCPDCYTVKDFCAEHNTGTYILALQSHVVAVKDGDYFDTWDSGDEAPIYYWEREDK